MGKMSTQYLKMGFKATTSRTWVSSHYNYTRAPPAHPLPHLQQVLFLFPEFQSSIRLAVRQLQHDLHHSVEKEQPRRTGLQRLRPLLQIAPGTRSAAIAPVGKFPSCTSGDNAGSVKAIFELTWADARSDCNQRRTIFFIKIKIFQYKVIMKIKILYLLSRNLFSSD